MEDGPQNIKAKTVKIKYVEREVVYLNLKYTIFMLLRDKLIEI